MHPFLQKHPFLQRNHDQKQNLLQPQTQKQTEKQHTSAAFGVAGTDDGFGAHLSFQQSRRACSGTFITPVTVHTAKTVNAQNKCTLSYAMATKAMAWVAEVSTKWGLRTSTVSASMQLFHTRISVSPISLKRIQLCLVGCLSLCCALFEPIMSKVGSQDFYSICARQYTEREIVGQTAKLAMRFSDILLVPTLDFYVGLLGCDGDATMDQSLFAVGLFFPGECVVTTFFACLREIPSPLGSPMSPAMTKNKNKIQLERQRLAAINRGLTHDHPVHLFVSKRLYRKQPD